MSILQKAEIKHFIKNYVSEIKASNAAIFAGAGLSIPSGFVTWKELLKDFAEELGLDIEKETDLISLAQFYCNKHSKNKLSQKLVSEFAKNAQPNQNHTLLASMPIHVYWTTNYDSLIEDALKKQHKTVDIKRTKKQLAVTNPGSQATVYKMHGDITSVENAVLVKDDYEIYELERKLFSTCLQGDLISKTFLFLGFSFDDPNLMYILSRIRILLDDHQRDHYCLMKKITETDFKSKEFSSEDERQKSYLYESAKQELRAADLKRYGITVIYIDTYNEITEILSEIEALVRRSNIFISGSAYHYAPITQSDAEDFIAELSSELIASGFNILSGFGLGIGSFVISGALKQLYSTNHSIEGRLRLFPFPQSSSGKELWAQYREDMLSQAGIAIFLFGNKLDEETQKTVFANGVRSEFEIASQNGCIPIPIGVTGSMAQELWNEVCNNFDKYSIPGHIRNLYKELGEAHFDKKKLVATVNAIVKALNKSGA